MTAVLQIPRLLSFDLDQIGDGLTLIIPEEFEIFICNDGKPKTDFCAKLKIYLKQLTTKSFRRQMNWDSIPVLISFDSESKVFRLASAKANRELSLLNSLESTPELIDSEELKQKYRQLRSHIEQMLSLKVEDFPSVIEWVSKKHDLVWFDGNEVYEELIQAEKELADKLLKNTMGYRSSFFEKFSDYGLNLTAQFALIRIHLLKFLAILPSLDHDVRGEEVKRLFHETFRRLTGDSVKAELKGLKGQQAPLPKTYFYLFKALLFVSGFIPASILAGAIRYKVKLLAKRFIAGESIENANQCLKSLASTSRDATLDQLGELVVSEKEADHYMNKVLELVYGLARHIRKGEKNGAGIPRSHVSIKVSALTSDFNPYDFEYTYKSVGPRLQKIFLAAKAEEVFINVDAEHYNSRDLVFKIFKRVLEQTPELKDYAGVGIVIQAYLRDGASHLEEVIEFAKERNLVMPLRLVKGAYWDAETIEADVEGHNAPQFINKEESDIHFRKLMFMILEASPYVQLCVASHNLGDHCFAQVLKKRYPEALPIEHQCLHMTYEGLSTGLTKMGWPVRNYVPIGNLLVGMAYLVRRIMENSSQVGILTMMRNHKTLGLPDDPLKVHHVKLKNGHLEYDKPVDQLSSLFYNVAPVRLYLKRDYNNYNAAIAEFQKNGLGKKIEQNLTLKEGAQNIYSPSDPELLVGQIEFGNREDALFVIEKVKESYKKSNWSTCSAIIRSSVLNKAAEIMLAERLNLAVHIQYESGKTAPESLADVDEAIDFLRFYAREEEELKMAYPKSQARGVMAVITPWNFPLAIPTGMVCASLVAGNAVIVKSAEQTPLIVEILVHILWQAGVPKDVLVHLPGNGETVGKTLVESDDIAGVIFTGSKDVGTWIAKEAGHRVYQRPTNDELILSKVITEMGGKNAIVVTANAELDEAVEGILYSAFGHAGQKCSAASRIIVHHSIKNRLLERLAQACEDIEVGTAFSYATYVNPLISGEDKRRLQVAARECHHEVKEYGGKVWVDRSLEDLPGHCVGPVLVEIPRKRALSSESMAQKEHFGPLIHVIGYDTDEQAIELFNGTEYALTGGLFSQSQDDIDFFLSKLEAGNLYVNRSCTGARVSIEPFGGFKNSGTGPKAGGKHYLRSFHYIRETESLFEEKSNDFESISQSDAKDVNLAKKWHGPIERLHGSVHKSIVRLLHQYTSLFEKIGEQDKSSLRALNNFIEESLDTFTHGNHANRVIPGQLSYNNYEMVRGQGLYLAYDAIPSIQGLIYVLCALLRGSGVTVLSTNRFAFEKWKNVEKLFKGEGISAQLFKVYALTEEDILKVCEDKLVEFVITDGDFGKLDKVNKVLSSTPGFKPVLLKQEAPSLDDLDSYFDAFTLVRSMAVNTMRHGAPLDLGF